MAVKSESPARARSDVQPAEKCIRQKYLLECVGARGGIIEIRAVCPAEKRIGFREHFSIVAGGTFALIINRRVENLLPPAGEFHVGQTFDLIKKIVDARRRKRIETPII